MPDTLSGRRFNAGPGQLVGRHLGHDPDAPAGSPASDTTLRLVGPTGRLGVHPVACTTAPSAACATTAHGNSGGEIG